MTKKINLECLFKLILKYSLELIFNFLTQKELRSKLSKYVIIYLNENK